MSTIRVASCITMFALIIWSSVAGADDFVRTSGDKFELAGQRFVVTGVNNHYLPYGKDAEVTRVLDDTVALGGTVVRTFLQPVIGSLDGVIPTIWNWKSNAVSSDLGVNGSYLLYWDTRSGQMAINDGPNGMQKIDFLIAEAKKRHLLLIFTFLDWWAYTGGAQQMLAWYQSADRNMFFMDPRLKHDYQNWVRHVLTRVNPLTGLRYKDDPTIMAWELMNEAQSNPSQLELAWVAEMSAFVKSQDHNHLVSSGNGDDNSRSIGNDLALPTIDFGTWHGYPLYIRISADQFDKLIPQYCDLARSYQKPLLLEEFGYARSNRNSVDIYAKWVNTLNHDKNCAGWLVWRLVSRQENGQYPADRKEQFDIRNDGSPIWKALKSATLPMPSLKAAIAP